MLTFIQEQTDGFSDSPCTHMLYKAYGLYFVLSTKDGDNWTITPCDNEGMVIGIPSILVSGSHTRAIEYLNEYHLY